MPTAVNGLEAYNIRVKRFDRVVSRFKCRRPGDLVAAHTLNKDAYDEMILAGKMYLSRVLKAPKPILDEDELVSRLVEMRGSIVNVTPTGMILPKNYSLIEYNGLMRSFYRAVSTLGMDDLIDNWQIPMHIRLKYPDVSQENLNRPRHAPEERHIDSWSGYSTCGITFLVPLLGDKLGNTVEFWKVKNPAEFREEWLLHQFDKTKERNIGDNYDLVDFELRAGEVLMWDAASLHATKRAPNCGVRVSIDNIFTPKLTPEERVIEVVSTERREEQRTHKELLDIGLNLLFLFPDSDSDKRDTKGGTKDPINFKLINY